MAVTIKDLRKEELFLSWEGTSIFSQVIANNGVDADIKLWMQAKVYAARIGQTSSFFIDETATSVIRYRPALDFIRICGEIESDKEHDRWWKMVMRGVLFTMVCTFAFNEYYGRKNDDEEVIAETEFNMMLDCINPDFSQFPSDDIIYEYAIEFLHDISSNYSKEGFYRYNVTDNSLFGENVVASEVENATDIDDVESVVMETESSSLILQKQERNIALKAAIEKVINKLRKNRHWFCILKVLEIHEFATDIADAAELVKNLVGEEKLELMKYKIDIDDLRRLNNGPMKKEVSKWEKDDGYYKTNRIYTYKRIAELFEKELVNAGLIEKAK